MRLRHPLRVLAVVAGVLACGACGIKGPLYLPPKTASDAPAAAPGTTPGAPAKAMPDAASGSSSPSSPPAAAPPVERKP